jgi:hypothetical protein
MIDLFAVVTSGGLLVFLETFPDFDWKPLCNAALNEISKAEWTAGVGQVSVAKHVVYYLRTEQVILIVRHPTVCLLFTFFTDGAC